MTQLADFRGQNAPSAISRGGTFSRAFTVSVGGVVQDLTDWGFEAVIRRRSDSTILVAFQGLGALGSIEAPAATERVLVIPAANTRELPPGTHTLLMWATLPGGDIRPVLEADFIISNTLLP